MNPDKPNSESQKDLKLEKFRMYIALVGVIGTVFMVYLLSSLNGVVKKYENNAELGKDLVLAMYQFNDIIELNENQKRIQELVTPEVFQEIGIDYNDNALNNYLKFKGTPSSVVFERIQPGCILYRIENKYITDSRVFVTVYTVNSSNKIEYLREGEFYDFR